MSWYRHTDHGMRAEALWQDVPQGGLSHTTQLACNRHPLFRAERGHVDGEAVFHIGFNESIVRFIYLLDGNNLDVDCAVVCTEKIKHLLSLTPSDRRTGQTASPEDETEGRHRKRLLKCPHEHHVAIVAKQVEVIAGTLEQLPPTGGRPFRQGLAHAHKPACQAPPRRQAGLPGCDPHAAGDEPPVRVRNPAEHQLV